MIFPAHAALSQTFRNNKKHVSQLFSPDGCHKEPPKARAKKQNEFQHFVFLFQKQPEIKAKYDKSGDLVLL